MFSMDTVINVMNININVCVPETDQVHPLMAALLHRFSQAFMLCGGAVDCTENQPPTKMSTKGSTANVLVLGIAGQPLRGPLASANRSELVWEHLRTHFMHISLL